MIQSSLLLLHAFPVSPKLKKKLGLGNKRNGLVCVPCGFGLELYRIKDPHKGIFFLSLRFDQRHF